MLFGVYLAILRYYNKNHPLQRLIDSWCWKGLKRSSNVFYKYSSSLQEEFRFLEIIQSTFYSIHPYISASFCLWLTDPLDPHKICLQLCRQQPFKIHLFDLFYSSTYFCDYKVIYMLIYFNNFFGFSKIIW